MRTARPITDWTSLEGSRQKQLYISFALEASTARIGSPPILAGESSHHLAIIPVQPRLKENGFLWAQGSGLIAFDRRSKSISLGACK